VLAARKRANLTVRTAAQVARIVTEKGRAVGVELKGRNGPQAVRAEAEVILSSGAIGSPRMLMPSGIGPADHLDLFTISECTGDHTYDKYAKPHWSAVAGLQYLLTKKS